MRIRRFGRLLGAAALLAVVALPGTVSAQGGPPPGGGGGGVIAVPGIVLGGGGGGAGGGGGLLLSVAFAPSLTFPLNSATLGVSTTRVDLTLNTTGLPLGSLVCLKENTTLVTCAVIDPLTGVAAFPHLPLTSIRLVPGSTFTIVQGLAGATIASATLH